jgi:hypothetical protein
MGISFRSLETEDGVEFAERIEVVYDCPAGHTVIVPFFVEAEIPTMWACRCGVDATARHCENHTANAPKRSRSHWEMLLERRSISELEELLAERLDVLRGNRPTVSQTG